MVAKSRKPGNHVAQERGVNVKYVPVVALKDALKLPPGDLRLEIAVARAVLQKLLESELDVAALVAGFDRASGALARLLKTNRQIGVEETEAFEAEVLKALKDLGHGV